MKRYRFVGTDGSCGYKHGRMYWGFTGWSNGDYLWVPLNPLRTIVPYATMGMFVNNWERP